ncbi:MAG TPA: recombinase family protein [Bacteroidia bacterium]|nr:recombinase family protein [Bacteroidia bacterium]
MTQQQIQLNNEEEEQILKDITSGRYKDTYLMYNRKSTDEPNNQKNSIRYQKAENARLILREHLPIAPITLPGFCSDGIISERHSGFKEDAALVFGEEGTVQYRIERPKFYRLVQFLSLGYFKGIVVLCWDRASRNDGDNTVIGKLMKQGVDFRFALASYEKTSSGALHMDIDGMFAIHHSRVTSEKVKLNIKMKRDQGVCIHKAPVGYLNLGKMEEKPLDPTRAPIIKKMFELYATGEWSIADILRWATEQGFTMPPSRNRRTKEEMLQEEDDDEEDDLKKIERKAICRIPSTSSTYNILTNHFYTGEVLNSKGEYIPSTSHEALVSKEIFEQVQKLLTRKKVSIHYEKLKIYPFRGLVRCAKCNRVYTPYTRKGINYFGSRCDKKCSNGKKNINLKHLTEAFDAIIQKLYFTENELERFEEAESTDIAVFEVKRHAELEINERKKKKIREDLAYINSNRLILLKTGAYTPEAIVKEESDLNHQLEVLQDEERISDVSMRETMKELIKLSELLKLVHSCYKRGNSAEREEIVRILFSELLFDETGLKYKCKREFQAFESRFIQSCELTTWLSELLKYSTYIRQGIKELELYQ